MYIAVGHKLRFFGRAKLLLSRTRDLDSGSAGASPSQSGEPQFSAAPGILSSAPKGCAVSTRGANVTTIHNLGWRSKLNV